MEALQSQGQQITIRNGNHLTDPAGDKNSPKNPVIGILIASIWCGGKVFKWGSHGTRVGLVNVVFDVPEMAHGCFPGFIDV